MWIIAQPKLKELINTDKIDGFYIKDKGINALDICICYKMHGEEYVYEHFLDEESAEMKFGKLIDVLRHDYGI